MTMQKLRIMLVAGAIAVLTTFAAQGVAYNATPFPGVEKVAPAGNQPGFGGGKVNINRVPAVVPKLDSRGFVVGFVANPMLVNNN